jgi:uncharacterized damage-inducible protein DinB
MPYIYVLSISGQFKCGWNGYNQILVNAVEPLTPEQLNWHPKEKFNSVRELVRHINLG